MGRVNETWKYIWKQIFYAILIKYKCVHAALKQWLVTKPLTESAFWYWIGDEPLFKQMMDYLYYAYMLHLLVHRLYALENTFNSMGADVMASCGAGNQQQLCCLWIRINGSSSSMGNDFNYLCQLRVEMWRKLFKFKQMRFVSQQITVSAHEASVGMRNMAQINSLWPRDAIGRYGTWPTLAQVMWLVAWQHRAIT